MSHFNLYYQKNEQPEILLDGGLDEHSLKRVIAAFELASDLDYYQNLRIEELKN